MARTGLLELVASELVAVELAEQLRQRVLTEPAHALGGELDPALSLLDEARVGEHAGDLGHAVQARRGVVAEQLSDPLDVGLCQSTGVRRAAHELLELVEVAELAHQRGGARHVERVHALELIAVPPPRVGHGLAEVLPELLDLPAQVHVLEQLVRQLLQLRTLLGRHRVEHRLRRGHATCHHLEQLVEGLGVLGEEVAVALHEPLEVGLLAGGPLVEHVVQLGHHVLEPGHVLGRHRAHRSRHLVDGLLHELLTQTVDEVLEALLRLVGGEVVLLEALDLSGQIGRQHVELEVLAGRGLRGELLAPGVAGLPRLVELALELVALLFDELAQLLRDVLVHAAQVEAVERILATLTDLLEHLADALDALAVAVLEALLHHPAQRRVEVAVVEQVVGQLLHDVERIDLEPALRAVPG